MTQKITALPRTKRRTSVPTSRLARVAKELNWSKKRLLGAHAAISNVKYQIAELTPDGYTTLEAKLRITQAKLEEALKIWDDTASNIRATVKKELDKERN